MKVKEDITCYLKQEDWSLLVKYEIPYETMIQNYLDNIVEYTRKTEKTYNIIDYKREKKRG